ncbi:reverse transcriptase domain-containing protein [Tanacetum coccineum]
MIICDKKIARIPYGNEKLIIQGDRSDGRSESRLNIISCAKILKYMYKQCYVFLTHITKKKSEEKRLEDVPIVWDFPEAFPEDLPGLSPTQQVIVDRLMKSAHFLPMKENNTMERLTRLYLKEVVSRQEVPVSTISDQDSRFTSHFLQSLQKTLGTHLYMSIAYHLQTNGQIERTIQNS